MLPQTQNLQMSAVAAVLMIAALTNWQNTKNIAAPLRSISESVLSNLSGSSADLALTCTLDDSNFEDTLVYKHQHLLNGKTCQDTDYLIIEPAQRGLGALAFSLVNMMGSNWDRTSVVSWPWNNETGFMSGVHNASLCPNQNASSAWECYFEPVSKCTVQDALDAAGAESIDNITVWNKAPPKTQVIKAKGFAHPGDHTIPQKVRAFPPTNMEGNFAASTPWKSQFIRYLLRFNKETKALLKPHVEALRASVKDVDTSHSIALLIRGSDKCNEDVSGKNEVHETDCLPFRAYMDAVQNVWESDQRVSDVLVTSEDSRYIKAVKNFAKGPPPPGFGTTNGGHKFTFRFNELDIQQGTSLIHNAISAGTISSHFDLIRSMWTTIELAVQARYLIINCESFFHGLVVAYRFSTCKGSGQAPPIVYCLDHTSRQNVAGFDINQIQKGGDYDGRWVY